MPQVTLSKLNSVTQDNFVSSYTPTAAQGSSQVIRVGYTTSPDIIRGLLKIDLGLIPNDAIINSATLKLVQTYTPNGADTVPIDIHKVTSAWDNSTNWNTQPTFDPTPVASFTAQANGLYSIDVKSLVQQWVNGAANHGLLLKRQNETAASYVEFGSFDNTTDANRPTLVIDYTIPSTGKKQVEYVGAGTRSDVTGGTSINLPMPAGIQAGDLLVAIVAISTTTDMATPSGWSKWMSKPSGNGLSYIFTKTAGVSESAVTFNSPSSTQNMVGIVYAFRNVKNVLTLNGQLINNSSQWYPPATTTLPTKSLVALLNVVDANGGYSFTPPLNYNEAYDTAGTRGALQMSYSYLHSKTAQSTSEMTSVYGSSVQSGTSWFLALEPKTNNPPSLTLTNPTDNQVLSEGQSLYKTDKTDFLFRITPSDSDTADTIEYSVLLRGITRTPYTSCSKDVQFDYTIPYSELLLGNNIVTVKIKDNNGAETIQTFIIRNKTPSTLSQKTVGDVLTAMGYSYTNTSSLQALKPSGYSGNLSMSDIINFLT